MICTSITENNPALLRYAEEFSDIIELRIDLIGKGWENIAARCRLPWIACDRKSPLEIEKVSSLGASMVDIDINEKNLIKKAKTAGLKCIVSYHDYSTTPALDKLMKIAAKQVALGAHVCKIVTTANKMEDNQTILNLIKKFKKENKNHSIVAFCMGPLGVISRVLCPLAGGAFTYASAKRGRESAPGQLPAGELYEIYGKLGFPRFRRASLFKIYRIVKQQ